MKVDTYAARLSPDDNLLLEVPLFTTFWRHESMETTYVQLATKADSTNRDQYFIASIPVDHPSTVVIDEDNWASFLYLELSGKEKMTRNYSVAMLPRGCKSISSHPSFGYYYFQIESIIGDFAILVDRPTIIRPKRHIKTATIVKHPYPIFNRPGVFYNDLGIYLSRQSSINTPGQNHDIYSATFKHKLSPRQIIEIYQYGIDSLHLHSLEFHHHTDEWDLQFCSVRGFEYFKSLDGEVIFTLEKNPVGKALSALGRSAPEDISSDHMGLVRGSIALKMIIEGADKPEIIREALLRIIGLLEMDDPQ